MAYQGNYMPQPMYGNAGGPINAGHHHQQLYPNAYPHPPASAVQLSGGSTAATAPSYIQPAQGPHPQAPASEAHALRGPGTPSQGQGQVHAHTHTQTYAQQQHVPNNHQTYAGSPSLMAPPPHVPDDSSFRRAAHLQQYQQQHQQQQQSQRQHQQQRLADRWPSSPGMSEEQRYMQEQYNGKQSVPSITDLRSYTPAPPVPSQVKY